MKTEKTSSQGEQGGLACEEEESRDCVVMESKCKPGGSDNCQME